MATMNISLPDKMKQWVEQQAETGRYSNASDYVRDLIRRDEERAQAVAELQLETDRGLASGISYRNWDDIMTYARARAAAALKERDGLPDNASS